MSSPVLFVIGAGPKIGLSVANGFAAKGYKVAIAARSVEDGFGKNGFYGVKIDLADSSKIEPAFAKVVKEVGIPSVVVYNAANRIVRDPKDPLAGLTSKELHEEFAVNTISPMLAAQEAVKGFKQLPDSASRTFIFTGNALNTERLMWPQVMTFAATKSATAKWIRKAAAAYNEKGYRFYYADQRQADGGATVPVEGDAAAEVYWELAEDQAQRNPLYTFVHGKGYVDFKGL